MESDETVKKIGLIDVDGHNFPNIPLMKISAWHKAQGDSVEWYDAMFSGHMDKVYMSKVFSASQDYEYFVDADEVIRGAAATASKPSTAANFTTKPKTPPCPQRWSIFTRTMTFTG